MKRASQLACLLLAMACTAELRASTAPPGVTVPAWADLSGQQQADLSAYSNRWDQLPASRRVLILERYQRWQSQSPADRKPLSRGERNFRDMPPDLRQKMRLSMKALSALPPEQRHQLREQWRAMDPGQRRAWLELGGPGIVNPPQ